MIKRFVITGGPATGKSAIIKLLQHQHYHCFREVSRKIIDEKKSRHLQKILILRQLFLIKEK